MDWGWSSVGLIDRNDAARSFILISTTAFSKQWLEYTRYKNDLLGSRMSFSRFDRHGAARSFILISATAFCKQSAIIWHMSRHGWSISLYKYKHQRVQYLILTHVQALAVTLTLQIYSKWNIYNTGYCKRGYFCWGKISRKCWQDISRGGNFHDTTPITFIKVYKFYFRVGKNFHVYSNDTVNSLICMTLTNS